MEPGQSQGSSLDGAQETQWLSKEKSGECMVAGVVVLL